MIFQDLLINTNLLFLVVYKVDIKYDIKNHDFSLKFQDNIFE